MNDDKSHSSEVRCRVDTSSKPDSDAIATSRQDATLYPAMVPSGIEGIQMTGNGLVVCRDSLSSDEYNSVFRTVLSLHKSSCWLLGDILLLGDRQWGNRYTESKYEDAMQATGLSRSTIRDIVLTCKRFPLEKRHAELSFTHHQEVAKINAAPEQREEVLSQAASDKLSCSALRKQLKQSRFSPQESMDDSQVEKESDPLGLLDLPERVAPDAPPLWDVMKFGDWVKKQSPDEYNREKCVQALELTKPIAEFYDEVKARLAELDEEESS